MKYISHAARNIALVIGATLAIGGMAAAATKNTTVTVTLWDKSNGTMGMILSANELKAGEVTFDVANTSATMQTHEFLVMPTRLTQEQLTTAEFATEEDGTKLDEKKLGQVHELDEDLAPGKSGKLTLALKPGRYLVLCNQPGHFMAGMRQIITVTP
ncbi:MAG TPA: plastocyanin/azurin family copper-binding protein [Dongiaceae bacterium]|jgi:uncharacterized cupredoxin-like copper-binding protein|nr:plastocyanin/azurin family copper-binding protein [Dongiaceae bacterium]